MPFQVGGGLRGLLGGITAELCFSKLFLLPLCYAICKGVEVLAHDLHVGVNGIQLVGDFCQCDGHFTQQRLNVLSHLQYFVLEETGFTLIHSFSHGVHTVILIQFVHNNRAFDITVLGFDYVEGVELGENIADLRAALFESSDLCIQCFGGELGMGEIGEGEIVGGLLFLEMFGCLLDRICLVFEFII